MPERIGDYAILEAKLGYSFRNKRLLEVALTHKSYANEHSSESREHNERLEFLGDAVLNLTVTHILMEEPSLRTEGELSRCRAFMVNEVGVANVAREIGLGEWLFLGKGEEQTGGRSKQSLLADACEALLGAIYLDGGFDAALGIVRKLFPPNTRMAVCGPVSGDAKTGLQEVVQGSFKCAPTYRVVSEKGPDHGKVFEVAVLVNGRELARGEGRSKKEAEQRAAAQALKRLQSSEAGERGSAGEVGNAGAGGPKVGGGGTQGDG